MKKTGLFAVVLFAATGCVSHKTATAGQKQEAVYAAGCVDSARISAVGVRHVTQALSMVVDSPVVIVGDPVGKRIVVTGKRLVINQTAKTRDTVCVQKSSAYRTVAAARVKTAAASASAKADVNLSGWVFLCGAALVVFAALCIGWQVIAKRIRL